MNDLNTSKTENHKTGYTTSGTFYSVYKIPQRHQSEFNQSPIPIVLIHGVGLNHAVWKPQVDRFKQSHSVITYDLMGHGNSSLPLEAVSLKDYAKQLDELLTHLQIPEAHIVGHSMGALISVSYLLTFPTRVVSTVPLNIVYRRTSEQKKAVVQRALDVLENNKIVGIEAALSRWFDDSVSSEYQQKVETVKNWIEQVDPIGYGRTYRLFAQSDDEFEGRLQEIETPVLFITGDKDSNSTAEMSQQMANETPNAKAIVIKNEAHMLAYINPDSVNPLIEGFIKKAEIKFLTKKTGEE